MEYCDGVNLLYLNKAWPKMKETNPNYHIPEKIIIYILKQMLEILDFLHNKYNIIDRDIKPNNILIDKHYKVKLIDFGLATNLPKNTIKSNNKYNLIENHINNNFYSEELIKYVQQLYSDDIKNRYFANDTLDNII